MNEIRFNPGAAWLGTPQPLRPQRADERIVERAAPHDQFDARPQAEPRFATPGASPAGLAAPAARPAPPAGIAGPAARPAPPASRPGPPATLTLLDETPATPPPSRPTAPQTLALVDAASAPVERRQRPLMLGPVPAGAVLPTADGPRTRALLNAMVSAPSPESRRIVVDQLAVYGLDAVSLVHNHGTQITVLPKGMKPDEAIREYRLDEKLAKEMKGATGGLFSSVNNTIYLREDMLSEGASAPVSAFVTRHEFAHALEDAMGSALDVQSLYRDAKAGKGGHTVSSYAREDKSEYFADSTAAWLGPRDEFSDSLNGLQRLLSGPMRALSGFEAPTREDLEKRDPRAKAMLDRLFDGGLADTQTIGRRRKDEGHEAWLWRSHQVDPSDERTRISLLEIHKSRASGVARIEAECMIEAEYEHVEQRLQSDVAARPADRKAVFRLVEHYLERSDRLRADPSPVTASQRKTLEDRAWQAAEVILTRDRAEVAAAGGQDRWQRRSDHEYLANQLQSRGMPDAAERVRKAMGQV